VFFAEVFWIRNKLPTAIINCGVCFGSVFEVVVCVFFIFCYLIYLSSFFIEVGVGTGFPRVLPPFSWLPANHRAYSLIAS
jgi:hypothetical protein